MGAETGRKTTSERLRDCLRDESGAAIVDYGVLVALLTVAVLGGYRAVGQALPALFDKIGVTFAEAFK
jgi:Flp pilus assembly pilin Flp